MISVIIPVYNSGRFLRQSVESALAQDEVSEVILVEDASPDNSYEICKELAEEFDRVKLFTHPEHQNRGAGATRNLAIKKSTQDYIAFLDSDDYYLPNRFKTALKTFQENKDADAVGDAVGVHFENEQARGVWTELGRELITTTTQPLTPKTFFQEQSPIGRSGQIHTNGWLVRNSFLSKTGLFNPKLRLHQDTELFMRFAIAGNIYTGEIQTPVAMRRVHDDNRITAKRSSKVSLKNRLNMWMSAWTWAKSNHYGSHAAIIMTKMNDFIYQLNGSFKGYLKNVSFTTSQHPRLLLSGTFHKVAMRSVCQLVKERVRKQQ